MTAEYSAEETGELKLRPWFEDWQQRWGEPLSWPRKTSPGGWDVKGHIERRQTVHVDPSLSALVLVDVDKEAYDMCIEDFSRYDPSNGRQLLKRVYELALPNTIRLVEFFRSRRLPVIYLQWDWHRNQYPPLVPRDGDVIVPKWQTGAFNASGLDAVLRKKQISAVFFAGADTSFCVESTVRGAVDCGYSAVVVEDACFSAFQQLHDSTMMTLGWHLAFFTTTDQVVDNYPWDRLPGVPHPIAEPEK